MDLNFAEPQRLELLWLLIPAALMCLFSWRRRQNRLGRILGPSSFPTNKASSPSAQVSMQLSRGRTALKALAILAALALIIIAWARPRWSFEWREIQRRGIDIMVAIDVSQSMLAQDIDPNRLERAKRKVSDLLGRLKGDRVGLVAFAGEAFVQCPLTEDYGAARNFLGLFDQTLIPIQGTDLGKAIDVSVQGLQEGAPDRTETDGGEFDGSRVLILITDGEDLEGRGRAAAERAKAQGVRIYTIGIGSAEGAPIPLPDGGFKKNAVGELVLTKPDEATLQAMSLATGGVFVRSVAGDIDLVELYDEGIKRQVAAQDYQSSRERLWHERFQWFLAAAFLLLLLEVFWRDVLRSRIQPVVSLLLTLGCALSVGFAQPARANAASEAEKAFGQGDYRKAAEDFQAAELAAPEVLEYAYNRAVSQYRLGDYRAAVDGFAKGARSDNPELRQKSLFNLGNAQVGVGDLEGAIKSYEEALMQNPDDQRAQDNLAYVKKLHEQQQEQKTQQDSEKQSSDAREDADKNSSKEHSSPEQSPNEQSPNETSKGEQQDQVSSDKPTPSAAAQGEDGKSDEPEQTSDPSSSPGADTPEQHDAEQTATSSPTDEQTAAKDDLSAGQDGSRSSENDGASAGSEQAQTDGQAASDLSRQMSRTEAERLLRSIDDDPRRFLAPMKSPPHAHENNKDW